MSLRDGLANQALPYIDENPVKPPAVCKFVPNPLGVSMRTSQFTIPIGTWEMVLPENKDRKYIAISNRGGNMGACNAGMAFDQKVIGSVYNIDEWIPHIAPTNAVYIYASDDNGTGSASINVQVVEG